jgi:hydrogenase maturation protease
VAARFREEVPVFLAGRPGPGLLDLLPPAEPCLLLDVTSSGSPPGTIHRIPLEALSVGSLPDARVSSHGFGPGETLALARAVGRPLPPGFFLGIEGSSYGIGEGLSEEVERALPGLEAAVREHLAAYLAM